MKARSYCLALCGLDVGAWRRHPNAVVRSQNLSGDWMAIHSPWSVVNCPPRSAWFVVAGYRIPRRPIDNCVSEKITQVIYGQ